ncbi:MBL fold metallo-hydrolase [Actinomadura geliboluensis]
MLETAAVDPDPLIAAAASPFLEGELTVPVVASRPAVPAVAPPLLETDAELRSQERKARELVRALRRDLEAERKENARVREELAAAVERAEYVEKTVRDLRTQVPSRRERQALTAASTHQSRLRELKRKLSVERKTREKEARALRALASEAEHALARTQEELEAERRGRRRLEAELGDATERARRLVPLVGRESADLRKNAAAMRDGPDKSRRLRRADRLEQLVASLRELYDLHSTQPADALVGDRAAPQQSAAARTTSRTLRVTPLGGANHIGGSALLVEAGGTRLLVDAGLKPQAHISRPGPDRIDEAVRGRIDAIVVTHAHADHAGFVPWVVEKQRRATVLCSPETKALLPTVWADSVRVMRAEADTPSQWNEHHEPPYGDAEVAQAEEALREVGFGQSTTVGDIKLTLFRAGHILGAAGVVIQAGDRRVVITGDIDDRGQASVGPAQIPPRLAAEADLLVIETTYCDSVHSDRAQESNDLVRRTEEVLAEGGRILVPAFGLGRAQEIALLLGERLPEADVLVDGLARDISDLYSLNGAPEVLRGNVRKVRERTREILGFHNGVIITTSGMLTGGAAIPWAQAVLAESESALFLCGHQDEEAPGRELERLVDADPESPRHVLLRDDQGRPVTVEVAAAIHRYNLSAHADSSGLAQIIDQVRPKAIMLVHGEPGPQALFRDRLAAAGYLVVSNREPWDVDSVQPDLRLTRWRHSTGPSRTRSPGRYRGRRR